MSFGFGSSSTGASGGFGGFGAASTGGGFGGTSAPAPAAASPFGAQSGSGGFGAGGFGAAKSAFGGGFGASGPAASGGFGAQQQPAGGGFGGFGAQQQQAPATGFGAPAATSTGFGGAAAGGFGAGAATSGGFGSGATSAFGGAGSSAALASPFAPKPAASASPFGSTGAFGGAATPGGFGTPAPAPATSGGLFGGGATTGGFGSVAKSPFGGGAGPTATTGGFGAAGGASAFGGGGFGTQQQQQPGATGPPQVGTGQPPYQPTREMEPTGTGGTANYMSISRMQAYAHKSAEELRYEDYLKRSNPQAAQAQAALNPAPGVGAATTGAGAFGGGAFGAQQPAASTGFGGGFGSAGAASTFGGAASTTGSAFGGSSGFGAPATGGFGGFGAQQPAQPAAGGSLFGAKPATGGFGAPAPSTGFGASTGGASAFGAPAAGGGFGAATTGGFGQSTGGFGTAAATPQQTGGFGTAAPAASGGFGATSAFGKPAASSGFGGFGSAAAPAAAPATGGFGGFGTTAQPAAGATTSLFGGATAAAPASSGFSFGGGATAPKPATSGGFGFGATGGTSSFGAATGGGFGAATGGTGAFGTAQPAAGTTSLFGGAGGATAGSTGGFGFGTTPGATGGASTGLFGAAKPATGGLFGGGSTGTGTTGSLFGGTGAATGGSSLFGGAATTPSTGATGFGTGGFGSSTGGFGSFGAATTPATQTGGFGSTTGSLFGQQPQQQATPAQPQNLVAAPDVNPYGAGSFGAGLVEQNVKAALDAQSIKTGASASSRLTSFTDDVGLPRGPMDVPLVTRRQSVSSRHAIPVSFIRGSFKGSKSRFSTFTSPALSSAPSSGGESSDEKEDEFKFSSSIFRNSVTKKLVIDKSDQVPARGAGASRANVVPLTESDRADIHEMGGARSRVLKPSEDGKYGVAFRNLTNNKSFTLRLAPTQTVKQARDEVKHLLKESASNASAISDIELILKGRIVHDAIAIEDLHLKEGDTMDVVVIEGGSQGDKKREDHTPSYASLLKKPEAQSEVAPPKRFMTYDEFLASASRDDNDEASALKEAQGGSSLPASPSCPTLKNEDYYTLPSYERLQTMSDQELSQVEKFTVGCRGLGAVEWIGKTDVRDLNIDELVFFEKKEVIVYKDDEKKHDLGKGLNKPAVIELLGIFPPRKSTSTDKYKDRVKQRTQDIGATFLDYSSDTGIWRFRVEHFSRYGFDDDDDDDDDVEMDGQNAPPNAGEGALQMSAANKVAGMIRGHLPSRVKGSFSTDRSGLVRQSAMFGGAVNTRHAVASFGEHQVVPSTSESWLDEQASNAPESELAMEDAEEEEEEEEVSVKKQQRPTSEVFPVLPYALKPLGVDSEGARLAPSQKSMTYQMMLQATNQPQSGVVRNHVDAGMFMARSFRCSWGPNGELVNLGKLVSRREDGPDAEQAGRRVAIEFPLRLMETRKTDLQEGLKMHYECTSQGRKSSRNSDCIDRDDDGSSSEAPAQFTLPSREPLMRCLHKYVAYAESRAKKAPTEQSQQRNLLLWKLVQALWGQEHAARMGNTDGSVFYPLAARDDPNEVETLDTFQTVDLRREAISQWFEAALNDASVVDAAAGPASPEGVLHLLCQHRIVEASEMAMECGDFRLATLVAQASSYEGSDFRALLETQMSQWSENGTLELMDETLVLVYSLLAGSVEVLSAQKGKSMAWTVCLALFLWYKRGSATSLKTAMALYQDAVANELATAPLSPFSEAGADKEDVLMELMKLYIEDASSLCKVLSPSGFISTQVSHHLDYELSWHLHSVLRAIGYKLDRQWESHIHQNFIRQLEGSGLWEEAVYVALNISDSGEREATCRALLFRNADLLAADVTKREELCTRLDVPMEWISEALAVRAVVKQERHEEIAHWMTAHRYEEAHACLIAHVAASCLFASEKDVLLQLLQELEPVAAYIPQWKSCEKVDALGGGLLLEYLRLEQQVGLEVGREDEFLQRVLTLSQQLSAARDASAESKSKGKSKNQSGGDKKDALVMQTCVSSMIVSLATQALQLQTLLSYTQERELTADAATSSTSSAETTTPLELKPDFLADLSHLVTGRETSFVESYRTSQLLHLCSTFIDWRA